jgi:hypothetical protein
MNEHRLSPRHRVLKTGHIAFSEKVPKLECTVRNLSDSGACLQISTTIGMPGHFDLTVDGERHSCRIVWRTETRLGVAFV